MFKNSKKVNECEHLIPLNEDWFVWKDFCLRGSGFDIDLIRRLSIEKSAVLAQEIYELKNRYKNLQKKITNSLTDCFEGGTETERKLFFKLKDKLWKNKISDSPQLPPSIRESVRELTGIQDQLTKTKVIFNEVFTEEWNETGRRLWKIGQTPNLQEAVIWQNRQAYQDFIRPWLETPLETPLKTRWKKRRELLLNNYLQRYTTKNDTIGFFGPVTWGNISDSENKISICEGDDFLAYRKVFTEGWAVDALAESFSADAEVAVWLKPRRLSYVRLDGNRLFVGDEKPQTLPPKFISVLELCTGDANVSEITKMIVGSKSGGITSEKEVVNILKMLEKREIISWGMEVPWIADFPSQMTFEQKLSEYIDNIENDEIKNRLANDFGRYLAALEETRKSAGDVEKLDDSLAVLEELFKEITGQAANRNAGKTYAGRTIVFEDCRRDMSVTVGKNVLDEISVPLTLLFTSARWLTNRTFDFYNEAFHTVYEEIVQRSENPVIEFFEFWKQANALFFHETANLAKKIVPEFQEKWQKILKLPKDEKTVAYTSDELTDAVNEEFFADVPGWSVAKYNSPDIMISARDTDHIEKGDFQYILGELHVGVNTLMNTMFLRVHENPAQILECLFKDFPHPRFIIVPPKEMVTSRNYPLFNLAKDYYLGFTKDAVDLGKGNYLEISDLIVEKVDGELFVFTRDKKNKFPMQTVFADILSGICTNLFKMTASDKHTPRITIDKLIVQRETWRFSLSDLNFAFEKEESERFLAAQLWRREAGLPRVVFLKLAGEIKPFYLDFDSPFLLENVCKNIKHLTEQDDGSTTAVFSELMPDFENLWLTNKKDEHFTSEFRFVFVDKKGLNL